MQKKNCKNCLFKLFVQKGEQNFFWLKLCPSLENFLVTPMMDLHQNKKFLKKNHERISALYLSLSILFSLSRVGTTPASIC